MRSRSSVVFPPPGGERMSVLKNRPSALKSCGAMSEEDIRAMCLAANCGVGLLASIHAASVDELHQKPLWRELLRARVFRRCIVIRSNGGARSYEVGDLPCSD